MRTLPYENARVHAGCHVMPIHNPKPKLTAEQERWIRLGQLLDQLTRDPSIYKRREAYEALRAEFPHHSMAQ